MQALFRRPSLPLRCVNTKLPPATRAFRPLFSRQAPQPLSNQAARPPAHDDMGKKDDTKKGGNFNLKVPKGTRDWAGDDAALRDNIFAKVTDVCKRHGATTLDTPVFELRDILSGKYGEDSKLIYDLADQGGEICSLRYDLTVPLARYLAMNPKIETLRRYQIAKVYRRDQPAMTKGRMREFYQCDIDIAGVYDPMIPDAEILRIATEVFKSLGWEKYTIKINHRKILDGIFKVAGVPESLLRPISSAVDKLDKMAWEEVKKEMLEKGLDEAVADTIGGYVKYKGAQDVIDIIKADEKLFACEDIKAGVQDMELLFSYLTAFGAMGHISFDLSLARGLDYYTGVIYEVVTEGSKAAEGARKGSEAAIGVGSVAAGGRYDELVGMFSGKPIPCVGISFGVDRIISIVKSQKTVIAKAKDVDVYIMAFGQKGFTGMLPERMQIASQLWDAGIKAEFSYKVKPKLPAQFKAAETADIPLAVILGEDEWNEGTVKLKEMGIRDKENPEKDGVPVKTADLVERVRAKLREVGEGVAALKIE